MRLSSYWRSRDGRIPIPGNQDLQRLPEARMSFSAIFLSNNAKGDYKWLHGATDSECSFAQKVIIFTTFSPLLTHVWSPVSFSTCKY